MPKATKRRRSVTTKNLHKFLGPQKYLPEEATRREDTVGVVSGLAWTEVGGDVLFVEASCRKGKKELILTGQMGDVMKESAQAALTYIKSKAEVLGISDRHLRYP